jgi:NAD(P)-dependent dehydrogenase (short-subunit alcohol dehydrogenase family)
VAVVVAKQKAIVHPAKVAKKRAAKSRIEPMVMKRAAKPEEIVPAFVYFVSEVDSSYATGEILTLSGGETTAG